MSVQRDLHQILTLLVLVITNNKALEFLDPTLLATSVDEEHSVS